jgi:formyl-CoA transferase
MLIAANQDTVFKRLAEAMGRAELAEDPRYATHSARGACQAELDDLIARWSETLEAEELGELLDRHGVPRGNIYRAPEMLADAHFKAREAICTVMHRQFGDLRMQNVAPKLSDTPGRVVHAGPQLGEHNDEVFRQVLGLNEQDIAKLSETGVIGGMDASRPRAAE